MQLENRTVIVTGAAQGIGRAFALRFAQEGANLGLIDLRQKEMEGVAHDIERMGRRVMTFARDISDEQAMADVALQLATSFGRIDVIVNNAGIHYDMKFRDNSIDYLKRVLEVNTLGALIVSRGAFRYMKQQRSGSIINVASTAAYQFVTSDALERDLDFIPSFQYSLSKAALISLTKFMAGTLGKYGIRVNCITPGLTNTEAVKKNLPPELIRELVRSNAMQTALEPEHIAGTAVYLATDESRYVTGQVIMVDAGLIMPA